MLEGFGSKCCMNFEGFPSISKENNVAQNTLWLHCVFPTMEVKPNLKYSSKYLRFLSTATVEMEIS